MALYSGPGYITYNNVPVLQSGSITMDFDSGNKDVDTLLLGRAGHSRGSKKYNLNVENPIPADGFEVDWTALANAQGEVPLGFVLAGRTYNFVGDIRTTNTRTSVDTPNSLSFTYSARLVGML